MCSVFTFTKVSEIFSCFRDTRTRSCTTRVVKMAPVRRRRIVSGGALIHHDRRRRRQQNVGGDAQVFFELKTDA